MIMGIVGKMEIMYAAEKKELFFAIKAGGIYFDALFAVLYDELAEIDRNKIIKPLDEQCEAVIYKDNGIGDKLNFFVLTYDNCGNICISAYIKTEDSFNFLCRFLEKFFSEYKNLSDFTLSVTDYYKSYVNDRITFASYTLQVESSGIYKPLCCVLKTSLVQNFPGGIAPSIVLMNIDHEPLSGSFRHDPDDYLEEIFKYTIKEPLYERCGIYAVFADASSPGEPLVFAGYLAFYNIDRYLDVSYVYVAEKWRGKGFAGALMSAFLHYCDENGYIPYYSNADGEESKQLAEKYGFEPLGERIEYIYYLQECKQ